MEPVCERIVGTSGHSHRVRQFVAEAARSDDPVLLVGEPGVGKELAARTIHRESARASEPFLMIDCALYFERELRREVFGASQSGSRATEREGLFEFARRGSCYLSSIEELTPALQADLLAFLRGRATARERSAGSERVRVIVSTERNLGGLVDGGLFSAELYRELSRLRLAIAPLRERAEDIPAVIEALLARQGLGDGAGARATLAPECVEALTCFPWPGNFDQLESEVLRALSAAEGLVRPEDLSFEISSYWLGQRGDPELRRVIAELDGYISEFRVLTRLDAEFGDVLLHVEDWEDSGPELL